MNAHTPGPWRLCVGNAAIEIRGGEVGDQTNPRICRVLVSDPLEEDNARRIVQCVNSHDALLAAAEAAYTRFADYRNEWPGRSTAEGQLLLSNLRDAIAAATGREACDVQDDYGTRAARAALSLAGQQGQKT